MRHEFPAFLANVVPQHELMSSFNGAIDPELHEEVKLVFLSANDTLPRLPTKGSLYSTLCLVNNFVRSVFPLRIRRCRRARRQQQEDRQNRHYSEHPGLSHVSGSEFENLVRYRMAWGLMVAGHQTPEVAISGPWGTGDPEDGPGASRVAMNSVGPFSNLLRGPQ